MSGQPSTTFYGFHGTDIANVEGILTNNFDVTRGQRDLWLGKGTYFYGSGISDPIQDAIDWARKCAYNKGSRRFDFKECAVIKAEINPTCLLDANTDDGKMSLNYARARLAQIVWQKVTWCDADLIQFLAQHMGLDVVICDLSIRTLQEIENKFNARLPNVRVICVRSASVINQSTLEVVRVEKTEP